MPVNTRDKAMLYLISHYPQWPGSSVTEEKPVKEPEYGRWRFVLTTDGDVIFANGLEPAITIYQFRYAQGNREIYDEH